MEVAFNELSVNKLTSISSVEFFYEQIEKLIILLELEDPISITFTDDFSYQNFNGLGTIHEIINRCSFNTEQKTHLLSLIMNAPFSNLSEDEEFKYKNFNIKGFHYAAINSCVCISIPDLEWSDFQYSIDNIRYCQQTSNIITTSIDINHIGDLNNISGTWLEKLIPISSFVNASEFIENIPEKYPSVILSQSSIEAISGFNLGKLNQLERIMGIFNGYCLNNWNGNFNKGTITRLGVAIKDESDRTMERYGNQRNFTNEINEKEKMRLHFNISEDYRGYVKPIGDKKLFIAYLGPHLSTVKFK